MARTHVFVGASLDGFIAGPNDELDWLSGGGDGGGSAEARASFARFFAGIGCVLMGRRTYDVVSGFQGPWPYGDTPLLVVTSRPLTPKVPSVQSASAPLEALVARAREIAGKRDVYIDGGKLIRSALDLGLVDEITVTVVPMILGAGIPLFA